MKTEHGFRSVEVRDDSGAIVGTRDVVTYPGLLSKAHEESLTRIKTQLIQIPDEGNGHTAIAKAEVETSRGTFEALGDANPENVEAFLIPHLIRVAETRAKARAFRDAVNIGVVSFEELGGASLIPESSDPGSGARRTNGQAGPSYPARSQGFAPRNGGNARPQVHVPDTSTLSEGQRRYLFRLMAAQGLRGEDAHEALKQRFGVENLSQISKVDATRAIDQLLKEAGGGNGHGPAYVQR